MEAKQYVIILALALWPTLVFGYNNDLIHPMLTEAGINSYQNNGGKSLSTSEVRAIKNGSIEEDGGVRSLEHFYDPINNLGLNRGQFSTSKLWAKNRASVDNTYSWEEAIYEYVYEDKIKGLNDLGHVVHLIQDKTVPEHTRDDAHPMVSTYEEYTKQKTSAPIVSPVYLSSIDDYFDQAARFTNSNFFSDDTILKYYSEPKIIKKIKEYGDDEKIRNYGYGKTGEKLVIVVNNFDSNGKIVENYLIYDKNDNKVMSSYWSVLAPRAVGYSAGVIKLFFDEVKKEQETHALQKARMPWWQKLAEVAKLKIDQALAMVGLAKNNPTVLTASGSNTPTGDRAVEPITNMTPEQIRLERLAVLENRLRSLRAELDSLKGVSSDNLFTVIRSINSSVASIGIVPMVEVVDLEAPTTTPEVSTTTATSTEDVLPVEEPLTLDLHIANCAFSLIADSCLIVATDTLALSWSVSRNGDYRYDLIKTYLNDNYEPVETTFLSATTTTQLSVESKIPTGEYFTTFYWQVAARQASTSDIVATSSKIQIDLHVSPLMINEIAWAGTVASDTDEWLELYNSSYQNIDLNNFYLSFGTTSTKINLSGQLKSNDYYLIERGSDDVITNRAASLIDSFGADPSIKSFDSANLNFKLWQKKDFGDILIEETPVWNKTGSQPSSLERVGFFRKSNDPTNWKDNIGCNEEDGPCALDRNATTTFGTPKVINFSSIGRLS